MKLGITRRLATGIALGTLVILFAACAASVTPAPAPAVPTNPPPSEAPAATIVSPTEAPAATTASSTEAPAATAAGASAPVAKPVTLQLAKNDTLGTLLTDGDGNTLYLFTKDTKGTCNCYDNCAAGLAPVIPEGQPTLKDGVSEALVGTTRARTEALSSPITAGPFIIMPKTKNRVTSPGRQWAKYGGLSRVRAM